MCCSRQTAWPEQGSWGVRTAGLPPGHSAQGVLLQRGFVSPAPAGTIRSTLGSSITMAGPCRGAVPPKTQLCPKVRAGDSPQGTQSSSCTQGSRGDPQRCRGAQLFPGTSPDLPGIQGPLLSSVAAQARCEISPLEMLQPGFMASVVSLSWLQLGKGWRGMKGAAAGGMAGEHFKGSRDTESR